MAVRSLHDRDFCPDAVEPHDAIDPPALDGDGVQDVLRPCVLARVPRGEPFREDGERALGGRRYRQREAYGILRCLLSYRLAVLIRRDCTDGKDSLHHPSAATEGPR